MSPPNTIKIHVGGEIGICSMSFSKMLLMLRNRNVQAGINWNVPWQCQLYQHHMNIEHSVVVVVDFGRNNENPMWWPYQTLSSTVLLVQLWISTAYIIETKSAEPVPLVHAPVYPSICFSSISSYRTKMSATIANLAKTTKTLYFVVFAGNQFLIRNQFFLCLCVGVLQISSVLYTNPNYHAESFPGQSKVHIIRTSASGSVLWKNTSGKERCQVKLLQDVFFRPLYKLVI